MNTPIALASTLLLIAFSGGCGEDTDNGATARLTAPADGAEVAGAVEVTMSADGVTIEPAGAAEPGSGHFHVIIDNGCLQPGQVIARDDAHVHFGDGSSTGRIYLSPGPHTLCLQVGDGAHTATDATDTVAIEVGITSREQWCLVMTQLDEAMASFGDHDFAAVQARAADAGRLLEQLSAATSFVDATSRPAVTQLVSLVGRQLDAVVTAETMLEAEQRAWGFDEGGVFADYTTEELAEIEDTGAAWARSACSVEVFD